MKPADLRLVVLLSFLACAPACGSSSSARGTTEADASGDDAAAFEAGIIPGDAATATEAGPRDAQVDASVDDDASLDAALDAADATLDAADATLDASVDAAGTPDAAQALPDQFIGPIPYTSSSDSPFQGLAFASYWYLEDWEDGACNTPGVTPSSTDTGATYGSLVDSVDGDDGVVDGICAKPNGLCNSGFAGGTISFTFDTADAAMLGALPTHVGIVWTDGSPACDATFEAFDANDVSLGTLTAAAVGDGDNYGGVSEDRFFGIVHAAGVKSVVVTSSAGGVEVDHLQYGR